MPAVTAIRTPLVTFHAMTVRATLKRPWNRALRHGSETQRHEEPGARMAGTSTRPVNPSGHRREARTTRASSRYRWKSESAPPAAPYCGTVKTWRKPSVLMSRNIGVLGGSSAGVRKSVSNVKSRVGGEYTLLQHL